MRAGSVIAVTAGVAMALLTPNGAAAAAGDLDPSFGTGGKFIQAFGPASSNLLAAAVQPNGKIVAAGWSEQSATDPGNADFELLRLNADGTIDTGFGGGDGVVTSAISAGTAEDIANAVALGPGGTIYVAGQTDPPVADFRDIAIARYDSTGTLDPGFGGGDGIVVLPQPNINSATAIQVQGDGKPVIAGGGPFVNDSDWLVARLETDGDLDPTFNPAGTTPGINTTSFTSSGDRPLALQILSDGRLLTAGAANASSTVADVALVQYTSGGVLDTAGFGAGTGKATLPLPEAQTAFALAIDSTGRPVVAGEQFNVTGSVFKDFLVARFGANGAPDTSFSGDGAQMTSFIAPDGTRFADASGVAVQPDGRILAAGDAFINCPGLGCADFALARYTDNGDLDPDFGTGGTKTLAIGADNDFAYSLVLQTTPAAGAGRGPGDTRAIVAGESGNSGDTMDRNSAAGVQLTGSGASCDTLKATKYVSTDGYRTVEQGTVSHRRGFVSFVIRVVAPAGCTWTLSETDSSLARFEFLLEPTVQDYPGYGTTDVFFEVVTPIGTGSLTNTVEVKGSDGRIVTTSATVVVYDVSSRLKRPSPSQVDGTASRTLEVLRPAASTSSRRLPGDAVAKVEVAVLRKPRGLEPLAKPKCEWLTKRGGFKGGKPNDDGVCDAPVWIKAKLGKEKKGKVPFGYEFKRDLPPGKYIAYSRATNEAGVAEPEFTKQIGNELKFKVKR